jgi:hypothetical protein
MPNIYMGPKAARVAQRNRKQKLQIVAQSETPPIQLPAVSAQPQTSEIAPPKSELVRIPIKESLSNTNARARVSKTDYPLLLISFVICAVGLTINFWYQFNRSSNPVEQWIYGIGGLALELGMFCLLNRAQQLFKARRLVACAVTLAVWPLCMAFALTNSLGFNAVNLIDTATARAERTSVEVADIQRRLNTLATSREQECRKRGPRCLDLEAQERTQYDALRAARGEVRQGADPQVASAQKLTSWITAGRVTPSADDISNLRLLLLTLLPQVGGIIFAIARKE